MREGAGSWLEGPTFQRSGTRGESLGLPAEGPGSLATPGIRIVAFVIDAIVANLLAGVPYLFGVRYGPGERGYAVYAAFLIMEFVLVSTAGATIGKQLFGIRVVRVDGDRLTWPWVLARTLLLGTLIPAVVWDRDGRGLHDKAAGAITIRTGGAAPGSVVSRSKPAVEPVRTAPAKAVRPTKAQAKPATKRRKKRR
jgi:uncharacterized RDD family membrane protein YckC